MQIVLPQLPYLYDALESYISLGTFERHHRMHHRTYADAPKRLAREARLADRPLEFILQQTAGQETHRTLHENAAQAWSHAFYWRSLRPYSRDPKGDLQSFIERDFGDVLPLLKALEAAAAAPDPVCRSQ